MKKILLIPLLLLIVAFAFGAEYTIGTGTGTQNYVPFYGFYDYSWSKTIYTKTEINAAGLTTAGNIDAIAFYVGNTPVNYEMLDQRVYIRHTTLATYGTATDETGTGYPNNTLFTYVFQGNLTFNGGGWFTIVFSTPFYWNNTDNLEILWENRDGEYVSGYPNFCYTTATNTCVYKYQDDSFPAVAGTRYSNRPNIKFGKIDSVPNPAVLVWPLNNGWAFTNDILSWQDGGNYPTGYDVYLDTVDGTTLVSDNQTGTTYTPTLEPETTYYWKVVPYNSFGPATGVVTWSFQTPTATQLAESFENTTFPPAGWANPGTWSRSTTYKKHGTASAYKSGSTSTQYILSTPKVTITETSTLNIWSYCSGTTGTLQIVYSPDRTTWTQIGSNITYAVASTWYNSVIDLSSLAGNNYYLALRTGLQSVSFYVDLAFGPEFTHEAPGPATLISPSNNSWVLPGNVTLSWNSPLTGGIPETYDVYFGATSDPPLVSSNQATTTYDVTVNEATTYYWKIVPGNIYGDATDCPIWSFKTPTATQLAESFENTSFPPAGWANPGTWSRSTSYKKHGTASAYKYGSTSTQYILSTPKVTITETSTLDLWTLCSSTSGTLQIVYSPDRTTWTQIGSNITHTATYTWYNTIVDLSSLAGNNYYMGIRTGLQSASYYVDLVFGPEFTPETPGAPSLSVPADLATDVNEFTTFTWTAPTTGGVPAGYKLYCDTNNPPVTMLADVTSLTTTLTTPLDYSTTYYWTVSAYNGAGESPTATVRSFTTRDDPTIYTLPWLEDFGTTGTTFPPTNWFRGTGLLADPTTITSSTSYWIQDNWLNDTTVSPVNFAAKMNIYGTNRSGWLITPPVQIPDTGYQLDLDIGLTDYGYYAPADAPTDDRFIILIGDGSSWSTANIVREWNNTGSPYVYDNIPYTGEHITISLDDYTGIKYIAFYGESIASGGDNDFFVDNVMIRQTPAGAPDHVTLVSPANGATYIDPENAEINWTPAITGGNPAYYEVLVGENPFNPEEGYFGEYSFETENTSLNLSEQDIILPFSSTWYWAVLPYNADGLCPDPLAHEFMVWSFTIAPDPTITSLPYIEYFDEVTEPALPWGWNAYINSTSTSAYVRTYSSTTYAQSPPNSVQLSNSSDTNADLRLISPPIDLSARSINRIKLKFYARSSTAGYPILIGTVSAKDSTGIFTQITSINLTATKTEYVISLQDYVGTDQYICFKHGLGGSYRSLYIDDVKFIELIPADLAATSISGPTFIQAGNSYDYSISVFNEGTAEQNSYTVNLKTGTETLATLNVNAPLASGATAQHTLSWIPADGGVYPLYGEVVLTGDGNPSNNSSNIISAYVVDPTMTIIPVGDDASTTTGNYLPLNMYYKNSVTEELYFTDEMHLQTGIITAIVYKNNFVETLLDKSVKIWMAHTDSTSLVNGWLPSANYTLVFDGTVTFPNGINEVVIPLDTPFNFTGGVLATRVNRPMDTSYYSSSDKFYYTTTAEHTNRSRYLQSDSETYNPLAPSAAGTAVGYVPNTIFIVQNAVMMQQAVLEGYVRDSVTNQPIEGATITLTERVTITTDVNGFYHYGFWNNTTVDLTAQKHSYYSQTVTNIVLTMGTTVTQNFNLVPLPRVTVSGIVTANDYPTGLVGATVKISGTENYETTTGTGGAFSISNVLGSADTLSYALTVEKEGYQTYISALNVATTNVNVGTINLTEYLWTPYNLVATHSGNNVSLTWEPAGVPNYYFCDFESDNGGWVSSGYGDWQWGHYNLANYMDIDTYTDTPPQSAHSGTGMWGTVLEGGYSNCNTWSYLRKTFDLSNFSNPVLSFWHYMNGYNTWDYGLIKVNGTTVWGNSSSAVFMPWQELTINLSAYANMNSVEISFEWFATATVSYAGWYIDDIYIGPASRNIVATQFASRSSGDRSFQNYSVYRFLTADEGTPSNWTLLQTGVADTTYMDTTFGTQPGGKYKWAVKANYSGSLQSNAIISNHLGKLAKPQNVVATKVGTTVQLSWTADPGADYYVIYAASDPYGTFTVLDYENTTSYTISAPLAKQFFKIASADGTMPIAKEIEPPAKSKK